MPSIKYRSIAHIPIMKQSQYLSNKKMIYISDFGSNCVNYANNHCLGDNNITKLANVEKCNSKFDKQSDIV